MNLFKFLKKTKENKVKEECCNKYWEEHKKLLLEVTSKYDLYELEPLEEVYNERVLLQNKEERFCYKYKLLKMWDTKNEKYVNFILLKAPYSSEYEFHQLECLGDFEPWIKSRIEQEIKTIGLDNETIGGAVEEEFVDVKDGHWIEKEE